MSEDGEDKAKYQIEMGQAYGPVIGDYAHVEQHFHEAPLPPPASREELLSAIHEASAELRAYPSDIADIHLVRSETAQIVEWALNAEPKERLGMLLDQPGGGKTVVMHDVLEQLEAAQVPTLAIKADTLSSIKTRADLAARLGLPAPLEECTRHLVAEGPCIVLLDQLDALSLALSRDQPTLDVMLDTLARLREIEGMRIVASCRTFDLNNDPRLSTIKVDRKFTLRPLEEEQVNQVLHVIRIEPGSLLPAHRELITVPLHLDVYSRIVTANPPGQTPENYRTLQDLYEALWRKRIEVVPPDQPPPSERIAAIYRLVEVMQNNRRLTAPVAVLDELSEAANYLEHEGVIRREGSRWLFLHQTLFDYCYARRFVAQGPSLTQEILEGPQGLFERSQMIQVLAYLRSLDEQTYLQELTSLLFSADLRVHLRLLLIGWFGTLPNPTDSELRIARRLVQEADGLAHFLQAAGDNAGWFDSLYPNALPGLLKSEEQIRMDIVINYLGTVIEKRPEAVLDLLNPYLGQSDTWDTRIAYCLSRLRNWQNAEALDTLCDLLEHGRMMGWESHCFRHLAQSNPEGGCRALRSYLDERLDALLAKEESELAVAGPDASVADHASITSHSIGGRQLVGEHFVQDLISRAVDVCPKDIVEHLLPWLQRAALALSTPTGITDYYPRDSVFAWGWYDEYISDGAAFARHVARALQHVAGTDPSAFREIARELSAVESLSIQRILMEAYGADPITYANDIARYLLEDNRRLHVGELGDPHYDSGRLYGLAFQYADPDLRVALERLILDYRPSPKLFGRGRQSRMQLYFLRNIPPDLLSEAALHRLRKLELKFPGYEPTPFRSGLLEEVGPPIEPAAQQKMPDEAWLGAMRKYDASTGWGAPREDFLKGGVVELSRSFTERVKEDPERFYRLAQRFDESIPLHYVAAAISGLAESDAPSDWVFNLVRQFVPRIEGEFRSGVCWALGKRAEDGIPDDLLDVMIDWALHDPDPSEELWQVSATGETPYYGGDPHHHGINSNRGAAIHVVCRCAWKRKPSQVERIFQLLEQSANDPSTAVRTCVIENLGPLLNEDDTRTLRSFEETLEGHPALLQNSLVHEFLYRTYYHHFPRIRPVIEALLASSDEATRQAGARLACLAAFQYADAHDLVEGVMQGDTAMRRGAAQVYARNLEKPEVRDVCQAQLVILMHDPEEAVRTHVGESFRHLQAEHFDELRPFVEQFLTSPALSEGASHVIEYLQALAIEEHETVLAASAHILDVAGDQILDIRTSLSVYEDDLVRLPLAVYTHATDPGVKSRAMDLFERMLLMGSREAHQALSDWDRR